jgi:hypothetical protein
MKGDVTAKSDGQGGVFYGTEIHVKGVGKAYALSDNPPKVRGVHPFPKSKRAMRKRHK